MGHFRDDILAKLPRNKPFKCPSCSFEAKDQFNLSKHYGLSHKCVFTFMQRELGYNWHLNNEESYTCLICHQAFLNARTLNDHYCAVHYLKQLSEGIPDQEPYNCHKCKFSSKNLLTLVRHLGSKHDMIKDLLNKDGIIAPSPSKTPKPQTPKQPPPPPPPPPTQYYPTNGEESPGGAGDWLSSQHYQNHQQPQPVVYKNEQQHSKPVSCPIL